MSTQETKKRKLPNYAQYLLETITKSHWLDKDVKFDKEGAYSNLEKISRIYFHSKDIAYKFYNSNKINSLKKNNNDLITITLYDQEFNVLEKFESGKK